MNPQHISKHSNVRRIWHLTSLIKLMQEHTFIQIIIQFFVCEELVVICKDIFGLAIRKVSILPSQRPLI